jgi:hypothetical protein
MKWTDVKLTLARPWWRIEMPGTPTVWSAL